jgi:dTDP-4-dehydrorhamnose reductase
MAAEAKKIGAALIHYSTDYVFDGSKRAPYDEIDSVNPINVYGKTKLAGEQAINQTFGVALPDWHDQLQGCFVSTLIAAKRAAD